MNALTGKCVAGLLQSRTYTGLSLQTAMCLAQAVAQQPNLRVISAVRSSSSANDSWRLREAVREAASTAVLGENLQHALACASVKQVQAGHAPKWVAA